MRKTSRFARPFLPGDSLLFTAGALAATGALDLWLTAILLVVAAVAGAASMTPSTFVLLEHESGWLRLDPK